MNDKTIARAIEIIKGKTDYIAGGMEGYAVLSLIDENGYPTSSTLSVSKADGINWITFLSGIDSNNAQRIAKCNKASVCFASPEYNISLIGTVEVLTDVETKKAMWQEPIGEMYNGPEDPNYCVIRFNTERYNIFLADDGTEAVGNI